VELTTFCTLNIAQKAVKVKRGALDRTTKAVNIMSVIAEGNDQVSESITYYSKKRLLAWKHADSLYLVEGAG